MARRKKLTFEEATRRAAKRQRLLNRLAAGNIETFTEKIAYILNHFPPTRNSDITLAIQYYQTFHPEHITDEQIHLDSFYELPKMYDMQRIRARIQNDYGLFLASEEVRRRRAHLAEEARFEYGYKDDLLPTLSIYSDESGKDRDFTVIGTVWFYNANREIQLASTLRQWKEEEDRPEEFKFGDLTYGSLPQAQEFFLLTLSQTDTIGFKAVAVQTDVAQRNQDQVVYRLYYETIVRGIEFELSHNRVGLPGVVFLSKDEDVGSDALWRAEFERKLIHDCKRLFDGKVEINGIEAFDSKQYELLQIADLFAGSVSRVLNRDTDGDRNQKDEFAEFVCDTLSIDPVSLEVYRESDWVMTHVFHANHA